MKVAVKKVVVLELTELEANWLKALMHNPFHGPPEDEEAFDKKYRKIFFDALNNK